jgi:hypothetical protein
MNGPGPNSVATKVFLRAKSLLVEVRRLLGRLPFNLLLTADGLEPIDAPPRHTQLRLGTLDRDLQRLGVEAKQHFA